LGLAELSSRRKLGMQNSRPLGFKIGIHYAWIIIVIAAFMHMAGGSVRQAFGVLIVPLQDQLGWSAASITLGYALCSITGALLAPLTGIATDRYGAKPVIMAGITFFFLGAMVTGVVSQVWHIWISYGLLLGVAQACFNVPILTAASSWFHKRLGLGIGLLQASHGLGPAIMALMVSFLITSFEWRTAFWSIGIVGGCIMLGLILLFRSRPSDMGIRAYGAPESEPIFEKLDPVLEKLRSKAFRTSMQSTSAFWKLVSVHYLGCLGHSIVIIYVIPIAVIAGVDLVSAAGILSTLMAVSVLTRFSTPVIADHLGAKWSMAIMFILQGLPVLMLFWTHELWQFYLFAVIFGIGYGGEGSAFPIINRQYFGRGPMGRSFGWQQAGAGAGMATGGWVGGLLYGFSGAYDATIVLSTVASVAGALVLLSMEPTSRLLIPNWEDSVATQTSRPQPA
jgi:MFS family permease